MSLALKIYWISYAFLIFIHVMKHLASYQQSEESTFQQLTQDHVSFDCSHTLKKKHFPLTLLPSNMMTTSL